MRLHAWWAGLQRLDRTLIIMVIVAGLALTGMYLRSSLGPASPVATLQGLTDSVPADSPGRRVLVIVNMDSVESVRIGTYYARKRQVPKSNIVQLHTSVDEELPQATYNKEIEAPTIAALKASKNTIDYMLFTRGVPIRIRENGYSVDCEVATAEIAKTAVTPAPLNGLSIIYNPYFAKGEAFTRAKYGFCLPCRLDGYTEADAMALVDHALAAKPEKGLFLLDGTESRSASGYGELNKDLGIAATALKAKGEEVKYDAGPDFVGSDQPLEGYASWGSNDAKFDVGIYHSLKFKVGAIAETFVSTSARSFRPTTGGQSMIADLIQQGVTGVKGYVSEPYTFALAVPSILFDRYTSGYNLAESFWMASRVIRWKDVVIGDPLCSPYHH